jgi:hypothetical protein
VDAVELERLGQRMNDLLRAQPGIVGPRQVRQRDGELVTGEAADRIAAPQLSFNRAAVCSSNRSPALCP